jgi:hypothetical protein
MGYVDKQIAIAQKQIGDAVAGKGLQKAIRALQEKSRITDSLKPLPNRGAITAKRKTAKRTGSTSGDFTEVSRVYYTTLREVHSADHLFTIEYYNVSKIVTDRATFSYIDWAVGD